MESENKQGLSSETISSDERSDQQVNQAATTTTTKRSYECTYCKRGFTNAQALGGHMNIHRKDRAKAKQHGHNNDNPIVFSNDFNHHQNNHDHHEIRSHNFMASSLPFATPTWYQPIDHYNTSHGNMNLSDHLSSGPSIASSFPFCYSNDNNQSNEEILGADLSLQIDSVPRFLDRDDDHHEEVLDLELRLGYR